MYKTILAAIMQLDTLCSIYKSFKCFFKTKLYCKQAYFTCEKCKQCAYAAIRPCTAIYMKPKCSHTPHAQYTRVSSCFFKTTWYCKQAYFSWEKCIQCAYGVFLSCTECALNNGCFIQRYKSDPDMYSTLRATKM